MDSSDASSQPAIEGDRGTSNPLLCPTCRRDAEAEIWAARSQVRGALLSVSRGGDAGLLLYHFDDALRGLACLADHQGLGVLDSPPDVAALRARLAEERHAVVSGAIAARTSAFRCVPPRPETRAWGESASHPLAIDEVLGQLAALRLVPGGGGGDPVQRPLRPSPDHDVLRPGTTEQRGEPRTTVRCEVLVSPGVRLSTAVDLSRGGVGCRSDQVLTTGTRVRVTFCRRCRLEAEGVVRWSSALPPGSGAVSPAPNLGVQFRKLLSATSVGGFAAVAHAA